MEICTSIMFFLIGIIFGSFFTVVGIRLPQKVPFVNGRSKCPHCSRELSWYDNIPLFSYLLLKGKCRRCHSLISFLYPLIELSTGLLFSFCYLQASSYTELALSLLFVSLLLISIIADLRYMLIPDKLLLFFLPAFLVLRIFDPLQPWWSAFLGGICGFLIIFLIIAISQGGMGAGDMKLLAVLGIVLGFPNVIIAFLLACISGAVFGGALLLIGILKRHQPFPFGPFISLGAFLTYFYGNTILTLYLEMLTF